MAGRPRNPENRVYLAEKLGESILIYDKTDPQMVEIVRKLRLVPRATQEISGKEYMILEKAHWMKL